MRLLISRREIINRDPDRKGKTSKFASWGQYRREERWQVFLNTSKLNNIVYNLSIVWIMLNYNNFSLLECILFDTIPRSLLLEVRRFACQCKPSWRHRNQKEHQLQRCLECGVSCCGGLTFLTSEDVSASTLHEGHESFVLDDLHAAVKGGFVEDTGSGSHHHSTSDGIDGVGSEARDDGDGWNGLKTGSQTMTHPIRGGRRSRRKHQVRGTWAWGYRKDRSKDLKAQGG